jgi:hypothetical protein
MINRRSPLLLALIVTAGAVPAIACGEKKPAVSANVTTGSASSASATNTAPPPSVSNTMAPPPSASSSAPPLAPVFTQDPAQLAALLAAAAAAGQALMQPPGTQPGDPAEAGLRNLSTTWAAGMTPEGQIAKGTLGPQGHSQFIINMAPGRCYTIIGFSPQGQITDLDLNLLAPPIYTMLAGQDGMTGNTAVIGKAPNPMCPISPIALPYKVDIYAKQGQGAFAVQVFAKNK